MHTKRAGQRGAWLSYYSRTLDDDDDDAEAGSLTALHARWMTWLVLLPLPVKLPLAPVPDRSARMTCDCVLVVL